MCDNKVNILEKWTPSIHLNRKTLCGECLKFNVTIIGKPDSDLQVNIGTINLNLNNPGIYGISVSSLFFTNDSVQTGQLCRSSVKNNIVYLSTIQNRYYISEYKINDTQCEYDVEFTYVAPP